MQKDDLIELLGEIAKGDLVDGCTLDDHPCSVAIRIINGDTYFEEPPPSGSSGEVTGYITDRISQKHLDTIVCLSRTIVRRSESGGNIKAPIKTMNEILKGYDK